MEQQRPPRTRNRRGGGGIPDGTGTDPQGMATVSHGPYAERLPVADMTVREIRHRLADRFDIDPASTPYIDGEPVQDDMVVRTGQLLWFSHRSGEKGR